MADNPADFRALSCNISILGPCVARFAAQRAIVLPESEVVLARAPLKRIKATITTINFRYRGVPVTINVALGLEELQWESVRNGR